MVREFRGDPAERGPGCHSSLWLLVITVFLVLAAGGCFGAVWKHKEPAEVAQRAVVSKTATTGDATAGRPRRTRSPQAPKGRQRRSPRR